MKQAPRTLLPAASTVPSLEQAEDQVKAKASKRQAVSRACNNCRKIKCKCDGIRPSCAKCLERNTTCVYDTEEGISRTASLRNINDILTMRVEKYEHNLNDLLSNNPSQETIALIAGLRAALGLNNEQRKDSLSEQSEASPGPTNRGLRSGPDKNHLEHRVSTEAYKPQYPLSQTRLASSSRQDSFAPPNTSIKWLYGGYNPNDGRIVGKQLGWHPILVINKSQEIQGAEFAKQLHVNGHQSTHPSAIDNDHEERFIKRPRSLLHETAWASSASPTRYLKRARVEFTEEKESEQNVPLQESLWRYHHANDREFSPPPGAVTAYGNLPMSSSLLTNGYPQTIQTHQILNCRVPDYAIPPIHVDEASSMSVMYMSFKEAALSQIGNGIPILEVLGHPDIVNVDLLFRSREPGDPWTANNWACELIKNIGGFDIYVQMAWVALLVKMMRWIVHPTSENYARLPSMIKPIVSQRLIPHSPAIDICPHSGMRQALMQNYRDWITPGLIANNGGITCWPGSFDEAVFQCHESGHFLLTQDFESYTQVLDNWEYPCTIYQNFPEAPEYDIKARHGGGAQWKSYDDRPNEGSFASTNSTLGYTGMQATEPSSGDIDQAELGLRILEHKALVYEHDKHRMAKYPPDEYYKNRPKVQKVYSSYPFSKTTPAEEQAFSQDFPAKSFTI